MDFQVAAPGGVAAGNPAALAARGADPAIQIPAVHFFRRIDGVTLQPVAGALVPVPTTLALSVVELVLGCTVSTNGVAVVEDLSFAVVGVLPAKYEVALAQLEAEPVGVGLNPNATYASLEDAAAQVLRAVLRVAARAGPLHPSYVLLAADTYMLEPMNVGAPAALIQLAAGPTALTFGMLKDANSVSHFLLNFGFVAFVCFGRSQAASRDAPGQPFRKVAQMMSAIAVAANFASAAPVGGLVSAASFSGWLQATQPASSVVFCFFSVAPDSREQNIRDRHALHYGTSGQKTALLGQLATRYPLRGDLVNLQRVFGDCVNPAAISGALVRLARIVSSSSSAMVDSVADLEGLDRSIVEAVRSLSTPGASVATLDDRVRLIQEVYQAGSESKAGSSSKPAAISLYSDALTLLLDSNLPGGWRTTEAALLAELALAVPNSLRIMELLTNSSVVGARRLALGQFGTDSETARLLSLSKPLSKAIDHLAGARDADHTDCVRYRVVADALVADPLTRVPTTSSQISFYLTFPDALAKQILRGAFNEIDWIRLLQLVIQVEAPGSGVPEFPNGLFDPLVPPLILPLMDRLSRLLGIPLAAPPPPAIAPPNFATLSTLVNTTTAEYSRIHAVPSGFTDSNDKKLRAFHAAAWEEASTVFHRTYGARNPAGPVLVSLLEPLSGAMAKLAELNRSMLTQKQTAHEQPELSSILESVAKHGSLEALIGARSERGRSPAADRRRDDRRSRSADRAPVREERSPRRSRSASAGREHPDRSKELVGHSSDRSSFWYRNQKGERSGQLHPYAQLEAMTGKSRHALCYPVVNSTKATAELRFQMCCNRGEPGHESPNSSAHVRPFRDYLEKVDQLFRAPATSRATSSAE
ncbi:MAG: hypothetical protein CBB71_23325 [Rhodopirellula sp. TMED11]|nr:MAG: hypothetical protein CBB71_23325 [Rhodopirellula sp. TMED11]